MGPMEAPWEHPDWYDLHDTAFSAGSEREAEHYKELLLALPPLGGDHRIVDLGTGTGKLACLVTASYPAIGQVTLVEPNAAKLERALERVTALVGGERVEAFGLALGEGAIDADTLQPAPNVALVGSVFMPAMELYRGSLREGLAWMGRALAEVHALLEPGGMLLLLETLALPWTKGELDDPCRRLNHLELSRELACAEFADIECVYRFRDRVVLRSRRP